MNITFVCEYKGDKSVGDYGSRSEVEIRDIYDILWDDIEMYKEDIKNMMSAEEVPRVYTKDEWDLESMGEYLGECEGDGKKISTKMEKQRVEYLRKVADRENEVLSPEEYHKKWGVI